MSTARNDAERLVEAVDSVAGPVRERLVEVSTLSDLETSEIANGLVHSSVLVRKVAERLLVEWSQLSVPERTAGLLMLAEALAGTDDR